MAAHRNRANRWKTRFTRKTARKLARQVRIWSPTVTSATYIVVVALWAAHGNGPGLG